ncbi:MAG TPA: DEAD/DEAH box helicase [Rudaea sp.]|nr:DEAD/DEAH box helicase [Rudaea sp.]
MSFETLGLSPALLRALADQGYTAPTAIQSAAIPVALGGRDLLAGAQTGTGKTAAFVLPLLERLYPNGQRPATPSRRPRALILTPTRELAAQVHDSLRDYAKHIRVSSTTIFGGVSMGPQMQALKRGVDILVATPGRLIDHMERRTADLSGIEILVLDEADRMLDMGFLPAIHRILSGVPKRRQTLLFSATFAEPIKQLASQFMREPEEIQIAARNSVAATVTHRVHPVDGDRKRDLLLHLLAADSRRQSLVFSRTKHGADKLCKFLEASGLRCAAIHGNKSQNARTRALQDFKNNKITILVATDIAARGLDIDQLPIVVNYDLPMVAEDYIHRIGRTGRAGAEGLAVSLVAHDEARLLRDIRRMLKRDIAIESVEGFAPSRPLNLESPPPRPNPRKQSHARRPHPHAPNKPHAAANKQHRPWRGNRDARKA